MCRNGVVADTGRLSYPLKHAAPWRNWQTQWIQNPADTLRISRKIRPILKPTWALAHHLPKSSATAGPSCGPSWRGVADVARGTPRRRPQVDHLSDRQLCAKARMRLIGAAQQRTPGTPVLDEDARFVRAQRHERSLGRAATGASTTYAANSSNRLGCAPRFSLALHISCRGRIKKPAGTPAGRVIASRASGEKPATRSGVYHARGIGFGRSRVGRVRSPPILAPPRPQDGFTSVAYA
jgi:hypothetical protein